MQANERLKEQLLQALLYCDLVEEIDWLPINSIFDETLLAMISPNAWYERKPYMLVKLCVPAGCCVAVTFSAFSSTCMHAALL